MPNQESNRMATWANENSSGKVKRIYLLEGKGIREWKSNHWAFWGWTWLLSIGIVLCRAASRPLMDRRRRWHTFFVPSFLSRCALGQSDWTTGDPSIIISLPHLSNLPTKPTTTTTTIPLTHTHTLFSSFFLMHSAAFAPFKLYLIHERR